MYEKIIELPLDSNVRYSQKEVSFITGLSMLEVRKIANGNPCTIEYMQENFKVGNFGKNNVFKDFLMQTNFNLWNKIKDLTSQRIKDEDSGKFKYPHIHKGAYSLIKKYSTPQAKSDFVEIMARTKYDNTWGEKGLINYKKELKSFIINGKDRL